MIAHEVIARMKGNTAAAFIAAGNRSISGLNAYPHTKDNVFVVCHDADTARVSSEACYQ